MKVYVASSNRRCHSNAIDAARLVLYLEANGVAQVFTPAECDIAVVTTCGSIAETRRHTVETLEELAGQIPPGSRVLAAGCLATIDPDLLRELRERGAAVDPLADLSTLDLLLNAEVPFSAVEERCFNDQLYDEHLKEDLLPGHDPLRRLARHLLRRTREVGRLHRFNQKLECALHLGKAHVQIGSGCVGQCAYCAIRMARGAPVSRPVDRILRDARRIHQPGSVLNLVADDCGAYGVDTGSSLFELLEALATGLPGVAVDLRYVNPVWVGREPERWVEAVRDYQINSINLCIQSGSDRVLAAMGRRYSAEEVLEVARRMGRASPDTLLRCHLMTGYGGETWADYLKTVRASLAFDLTNSYVYSPPPWSDDQPDLRTAKARKLLLELLNLARFPSWWS